MSLSSAQLDELSQALAERLYVQVTGWQTPRRQLSLAQSPLSVQLSPSAQVLQVPPPQSMSVSASSWSRLLQFPAPFPVPVSGVVLSMGTTLVSPAPESPGAPVSTAKVGNP